MIYPRPTMYPGEDSAFPSYADVWISDTELAWSQDTDDTWPEE